MEAPRGTTLIRRPSPASALFRTL